MERIAGMRRFLMKTVFYGLVFAVLANLLSWGCFAVLRRADMYKPSYVAHREGGREFDYVVLGSSTGLVDLNTALIDSLTGLNGFNLSLDGMGPAGQYMMLEHFLSEGYAARRIILSVDQTAYADTQAIDMNEFYFLPWVGKDYVYWTFAEREPGLLKIRAYSRYFPMIGLGYYNQQLLGSCAIAFAAPRHRWYFDEKGNFTYPGVLDSLAWVGKELIVDTLRIRNPYVHEMQRRCRQEGMELFYFLPPELGRKTVVLDSANCHVWNYRDAYNRRMSFFHDAVHLNREGRSDLSQKVVERMCSWR